MTINNYAAEKAVKKQKTGSEKEEETDDTDSKQKWVQFLAAAENSKNFHRYSPEKNGVTRLGAKLSPHPNANKELYKALTKNLKSKEANENRSNIKSFIKKLTAAISIDGFEEKIEDEALIKGEEDLCKFIKSISGTMLKVFSKRPSITCSETIYNTNMLFPCFEALVSSMKKNKQTLYFIPGEYELNSMSEQLEKMGQKPNKRKIYKADGIMRLENLHGIEVLLLETAGAFNQNEHGKVAFDNFKGMFALLWMLKTIADRYKFASVEEFSKLKLYFVQPSGCHLRLWSMKYAKHGIYDFVREDKIVLSEDYDRREEQLISVVNFFLTLKNQLEETVNTIVSLKEEHEQNEKNEDSDFNSQIILLSDIICPKIFKLSYNTHGQNFSKEYLMSSPESDV